MKNRKLKFEKKNGVIDKREFEVIIEKDIVTYPPSTAEMIEIEVFDIPNLIIREWYGQEERNFISDLEEIDEIKNLEDGEYKLTIVGTLTYYKGYFDDYGDLETNLTIKKIQNINL